MTRDLLKIVLIIAFSFSVISSASSQYKKPAKPMKYWTKKEFKDWEKNERSNSLFKATAHEHRNFGLHDGNNIRTLFYNFGSIGRPNTEPSIEWPIYSGHGYGYEFGPMVGAEVIGAKNDTLHIFSDSMLDGGDVDRFGGANVWGWEPLPGYAVDPDVYNSWSPQEQDRGGIAVSSRPQTWGELFPKDDEGNLLWPGQFGSGRVTADLESYFVFDDRYNSEFSYYPFISDSSRRGLGIQVTARGYQYSAQLAEDILFFQYEIKNISEKRLDKVVVGVIGDPHIGGPGDFSDDYAGFDENLNMVFSWDKPGSGNDFGIPWESLGWLGFKFLESPGNSEDGADNDNDGMIDESRNSGAGSLVTGTLNGVPMQHFSGDEDGDWQATNELAKADVKEQNTYNGMDDDGDGRIDDWGDLDGKSDDVGADGSPDTDDEGEGDGIPTPGEPDFDLSDLDESDMLGLTSFTAPVYETKTADEDDVMWEEFKPGTYGQQYIKQEADNIFVFGAGYFPLEKGQSEKFSIAIILGENEQDMRDNALVAQTIFSLNFQFTKPPDILPTLTAVAGDGKVTLYWNDAAENSFDPIYGKDFEGYALYRSSDKVSWGDEVTDYNGIKVYNVPITQFDKKNNIKGMHPVSVKGAHFNMGNDTGLEYAYVDSNLINGITYYYALTAYDTGSVVGGIPPLESSKMIGASNVVSVTPNATPLGYEAPAVNLAHTGLADAVVWSTILDRTKIDSMTYEITFTNTPANKLAMSVKNITHNTSILDAQTNFSDVLFTFENLQFKITDLPLATIEEGLTKWNDGNTTLDFKINPYPNGKRYARDLEIRFSDTVVDTSSLVSPKPVKFQVWNINDNIKLDFVFFDTQKDGNVTPGDKIVPLLPKTNTGTWQIEFSAPAAGETILPGSGDTLQIFVTKPLESSDKYSLTTLPAMIRKNQVAAELHRIAVVPNPYVSASSLEPKPEVVFSAGRGERRVDFIHLPKDCIIRIYTVAGEHIKTIEHNGTKFDGTEPWNLLSKDNLEIASGIYIYHVEAYYNELPGKKEKIGEKIGRIAVIK